jgi:hypothetical protein
MLSGPCFVMLRELFPSLLSQHMFLLKLQKGLVPLPCNCFMFFSLLYDKVIQQKKKKKKKKRMQKQKPLVLVWHPCLGVILNDLPFVYLSL